MLNPGSRGDLNLAFSEDGDVSMQRVVAGSTGLACGVAAHARRSTGHDDGKCIRPGSRELGQQAFGHVGRINVDALAHDRKASCMTDVEGC